MTSSSENRLRQPLTVQGAPASEPDRVRLTAEFMAGLCARFPSTAQWGAGGWKPDVLDEWAASIWKEISEDLDPVLAEEAELEGFSTLPASMMGLTTARFLLHLWEPDREWRCGKIDLIRALTCIWDAEHRKEFLKWSRLPVCR